MAFKNKIKNRQIVDDRQTLDAKHNNILQSFNDDKEGIINLYEELNKINSIIDELNIDNSKSPFLNINLQKQICL